MWYFTGKGQLTILLATEIWFLINIQPHLCPRVKLLNRSAVLSIRAEVVDQCLEVFDMQVSQNLIVTQIHENTPNNIHLKRLFFCFFYLQGAPLSCLCFGPVYFGTSSVEKVVLRNNGPQACDWVCLLQHNAAGTEAVSDAFTKTFAHLEACCTE